MKLRQGLTRSLPRVLITKPLRRRLVVDAPVLPSATALPPDFVAEEDLVEASSLPLTRAERQALIAVGLPLSGATARQACSAAELSEDLAEAIFVSRMDPKYDFLNVILVEPAQVADFVLNWLETGTRAASVREQAELFAKFMDSIKIVLGLSNEDLAHALSVSRRTVRQWSNGNCTLSRAAQEVLLRRLAAADLKIG